MSVLHLTAVVRFFIVVAGGAGLVTLVAARSCSVCPCYGRRTACLCLCRACVYFRSLVLGSREGGSGGSGWRLRCWWLACWLSRLALKPLLRLGVLAVPPSMVQYSRSGVTLVTDTLLPGLCERVSEDGVCVHVCVCVFLATVRRPFAACRAVQGYRNVGSCTALQWRLQMH